MNIAVILSGGIGSRLGNDSPKQFFKVAGKTVIEHTIEVFECHAEIDEIVVVIHPLYVSTIEDMIISNGWTKVKKILIGGKERYESSLVAIKAYSSQPNYNLIFHDAVRPLVSARIISDIIKALTKYNAVDVAIPATDTIIEMEKNGNFINSIPNRNFLRRGQTPQGFKQSTIATAYEIALQDTFFVSTDDCGIVVKYLPDEKVFVVKGEESNMKLTYKEDSYLLDKLFQLQSFAFYGDNSLEDINDKVVVVFGGNSGIGKEIINLSQQNGAKSFPFSRSLTNTDISVRESVKDSLASVYNQTGCIDYIVNTAAILVKEPLVSMSPEIINELIQTNYIGMVNVALESYYYLKKSQGHLLLYTSSSYTRGRAFYSLYSSTKAAVVNFAQALAQEWEKSNIRVNVINPERTKTPMRIQNFGNELEETLLSAESVAAISIKTLLSNFSGQIIDIKK